MKISQLEQLDKVSRWVGLLGVTAAHLWVLFGTFKAFLMEYESSPEAILGQVLGGLAFISMLFILIESIKFWWLIKTGNARPGIPFYGFGQTWISPDELRFPKVYRVFYFLNCGLFLTLILLTVAGFLLDKFWPEVWAGFFV